VKAPEVWPVRDGEGFVIANADTGVQWDHPALINQYRGYNGGAVNHNYHWWDAIHAGGSSCGASSQVPCDDNGHGTHTTGTAVGHVPALNHFYGVAPGAKWIACRNMNAGNGVPATYIECLEFFVAPTDLTGQNPNPAMAPHVIGNSYGCTASEGCESDSLDEALETVHAAGIFMSVSSGNSGSGCSTIFDPPATHPSVCSVGATGFQSNTIAFFSSRGPVNGRIGPSLVAPGSNVRSSYPRNSYASLSGTSMASPHVTGVIALIWSAHAHLLRDPTATIKHIGETCTVIPSTLCSSPSSSPNNVYGHGQLDCQKGAL